jgi:hypothetical protein
MAEKRKQAAVIPLRAGQERAHHTFRKARAGTKRSFWQRRIGIHGVIAGVVFCVVYVWIGLFLVTSPWPVAVSLRHLAASQNCDAARAFGLAPSYRGRPATMRAMIAIRTASLASLIRLAAGF